MLVSLLPLLMGALALPAPDPCALVTPAEITTALGASPAAPQREGPEKDEDLGGTSSSCSRQVGERVLRFDLVEFTTAAGAAKAMELVVTSSRRNAEGMQLSTASGLGEQSLSAAAEEGALWTFRKGRYMVTVSLAGEGVNVALQGKLKGLAGLAVGRVGG